MTQTRRLAALLEADVGGVFTAVFIPKIGSTGSIPSAFQQTKILP